MKANASSAPLACATCCRRFCAASPSEGLVPDLQSRGAHRHAGLRPSRQRKLFQQPLRLQHTALYAAAEIASRLDDPREAFAAADPDANAPFDADRCTATAFIEAESGFGHIARHRKADARQMAA